MMNIAIRADSSTQMGTGHIMRCLTLANALKTKCSANVYFFCRNTVGNINKAILDAGHLLIEMLPPSNVDKGHLAHSSWLGSAQDEDAKEFLMLMGQPIAEATVVPKHFDFIVIDHYAIDCLWHKAVRRVTDNIVVIDDLGDRQHDCDYLIDQTFQCSTAKYKNKVPLHCQLQLGTDYAMLRPEFNVEARFGLNQHQLVDKRIAQLNANQEQRRLLIMFGGTDPDNLSLQTLKLLSAQSNRYYVDIILGSSAKHIEEVKDYCENHLQFTLHVAPKNIAQLMLNADLAIGAAGATSWERCALGLPSLLIVQARNQIEIAKALTRAGAVQSFEATELDTLLIERLAALTDSQLIQMINNCVSVCDGLGANRLVKRILLDNSSN
ncbi:UDP-2,4-diacetamido-2,4,6-trideoxy-beta-L-altropyranose hydrolase [Thalassotalea montiporae]